MIAPSSDGWGVTGSERSNQRITFYQLSPTTSYPRITDMMRALHRLTVVSLLPATSGLSRRQQRAVSIQTAPRLHVWTVLLRTLRTRHDRQFQFFLNSHSATNLTVNLFRQQQVLVFIASLISAVFVHSRRANEIEDDRILLTKGVEGLQFHPILSLPQILMTLKQ